MRVYLRDRFDQTILRAATLRYKLQIKSRCIKPKSLYATNTTIVILATLKALSAVFIAEAFTPKTLFLATPVTLSSSKNYYSSTMYAKNTIPINDHAK